MKIKLSRSQWEEIGKQVGWLKESSNYCGGFKKPKKGKHLDTQMYPECEGFESQRNVFNKKVREKSKKSKKNKKGK